MNLPWRREPLTGESLIEEAQRFGVSLYDLPSGARLRPGGDLDPAIEPKFGDAFASPAPTVGSINFRRAALSAVLFLRWRSRSGTAACSRSANRPT